MKPKLFLASLLLSMSVSLGSYAYPIILKGNIDKNTGGSVLFISDTQYTITSEVTLGYSTITMYDKSGNELYSTPAYIAAGTTNFTIPSGIAQQIDYVVVEYNDDILCGKAE